MTFSSTFLFFFSFIFISWRLITLQHCSGFCHTLNMQQVPDRMLDAKGEKEFDIKGTGLQQDREIRYITNEQYRAMGAVSNIMIWILQDPPVPASVHQLIQVSSPHICQFWLLSVNFDWSHFLPTHHWLILKHYLFYQSIYLSSTETIYILIYW